MDQEASLSPKARTRGDPLVLVRVPFGLLFLASGTLKYYDLSAFQQALARFNLLPDEMITPMGMMIPAVELFLGTMIVLGRFTGAMSLACCILLTVFTGVIIAKVTEGAQVSCACFGSVSSGPIGWWTVARNCALMLSGAILAAYYQPMPDSGGLLHTLKYTALYSVLCLLLTGVVAMALQNRLLKARVAVLTREGLSLQPGMAVYPFQGLHLDGSPVRVDYEDDERTLMFAMNSRCQDCMANVRLWTAFAEQAAANRFRVFGVILDSLEASQRYARTRRFPFHLYCVPYRTFAIDYRVVLVPQTILIRENRVEQVWTGVLSTRDSVDISLRLTTPVRADPSTREEVRHE